MSRIYRWFVVAARHSALLFTMLVILTAFCGWQGYGAAEPQLSVGTVLFRIIKLYGIEAENTQANVNAWLEAARWLGCSVWAWAIGAVIASIFHQPLLRLLSRGPWCRKHVIIAGLGPDGDRLASRLCESGHTVVVVERDSAHPGIKSCRDAGAIVLRGDLTRSGELMMAGVRRASHLLALYGRDRQNVQTATIAAQLVGLANTNRAKAGCSLPAGALACTIQVAEPQLMEALADHALLRVDQTVFKLSVLNCYERAARAMWREATRGISGGTLRRIVVVGDAQRLGTCVILRAVKDWYIEHNGAAGHDRFDVHFYEREATQWIEHLRRRCHGCDAVARISGHDCWPEHYAGDDAVAVDEGGRCRIDAVFICVAGEELCLAQARRLRKSLPQVPIVARVEQRGEGLDTLLDKGLETAQNIQTVGVFDRLFDPLSVLNPAEEELALTLHQDYLALVQKKIAAAKASHEMADAERLAQKPAFMSWDELSPGLRDSNRELARRLRRLIDTGAGARTFRLVYSPDKLLNPLADWHLSDNSSDIEDLARQEHDGWCAHQLSTGWRFGSKRDDGAKIHCDLVPWEQLGEEEREYDRNIIRRLPYVFAKADFQLIESTTADRNI